MIPQENDMLKIGSKVRFTYLKEAQKGIVNGILTADYACLLYTSDAADE